MKHVIDFRLLYHYKTGDVVLDEPVIFVAGKVSNVRDVTSDEVVNRDDAMTFRQQTIGQMRSEKTRATGNDGNRVRFFLGHGALTNVWSREYASRNEFTPAEDDRHF